MMTIGTSLRAFITFTLLLGGASARCLAQVRPPAPLPPAPVPLDSTAALAALLTDAARVNAQVPDRLRAYRARIESEMSLVMLDSGGRERTAQLEQVASDVR